MAEVLSVLPECDAELVSPAICNVVLLTFPALLAAYSPAGSGNAPYSPEAEGEAASDVFTC